jgi:tripartite ATP-independent transporter DctM subunit
MEWWLILLIIFGSLVFLLLIGVPVAFSFLLIDIVGVFIFWRGEVGLSQLILSIYDSVSNLALLPVPLFVLMGEIMFQSGIASRMMDTLDKWLGRLPGRLSLLAVAGGTVFATLSGSSLAGAAMLGSVLVPEMQKRGYKKSMALGPILGSGGLAIMIPPSALGVLMAALSRISVGQLLIAIIIPGLLMAFLFAIYILVRCVLEPDLAPSYEVMQTPWHDKISQTVRYVLPLSGVVFLVVGLIFLGITSPTEAAATGGLGCLILACIYWGGMRWDLLKKSVEGASRVTIMMFMILTGSTAFSQILAFTGASQGLVRFTLGLPLSPYFILIGMQVILLIMGMFMEPLTIMMTTLPIFIPIVTTLGFDLLWFGTIMLLNMEMATISPPFGLVLFVMKGVAPKGTTMGDIYRAAVPFLGCDLIAMALIMVFPSIALWLPSLMKPS